MKNVQSANNDRERLVALLMGCNGGAVPMRYFGERLGVSGRTVLRWLLAMEVDGWVEVERYGAPTPPLITVTEEGRRRLAEYESAQRYAAESIRAARLEELLAHVLYQPARQELERRIGAWRSQ